jgi:hypothetical protein
VGKTIRDIGWIPVPLIVETLGGPDSLAHPFEALVGEREPVQRARALGIALAFGIEQFHRTFIIAVLVGGDSLFLLGVGVVRRRLRGARDPGNEQQGD